MLRLVLLLFLRPDIVRADNGSTAPDVGVLVAHSGVEFFDLRLFLVFHIMFFDSSAKLSRCSSMARAYLIATKNLPFSLGRKRVFKG